MVEACRWCAHMMPHVLAAIMKDRRVSMSDDPIAPTASRFPKWTKNDTRFSPTWPRRLALHSHSLPRMCVCGGGGWGAVL